MCIRDRINIDTIAEKSDLGYMAMIEGNKRPDNAEYDDEGLKKLAELNKNSMSCLLYTSPVERNCGHAWLFRIRKKPAGPFYSKGHVKYLTLWLYAAGFLPSVLLFADLKLCNPCRKSL